MMRPRLLVSALGAALALIPAAPAAATVGAQNVQFNITGSLQSFPCPSGNCAATVGGTGTGAGHAIAIIGGDPYDATFTIYPSGTLSGSAVYAEPGQPFCPLVGFANTPTTGSITLSGGTTGIIYNLKRPLNGGIVTSASTTLQFSYTRIGVTPVINITGGSVTVNYYFPATGAGSFTEALVPNVGAGTGVFSFTQATPSQVLAYCQGTAGQDVPYSLTGDAVIATSSS
jgi:hypothetical protein